jgi:hypothetical protein
MFYGVRDELGHRRKLNGFFNTPKNPSLTISGLPEIRITGS